MRLLILNFLISFTLFGQAGQPLVYEPFDYAAFNPLWNLDGGSGAWVGKWERVIGDDVILRRGNLNYPGLAAGEGTRAAVEFVRAGIRYNRKIIRILDNGEAVWIGILVDFLPGSAADNVGNLTLNNNGEQVLSIGRKFGNRLLGLAGPGIGRFNSTVVAEGLHWLVMRIGFSGDGGQEDLHVWIDPDPTQTPTLANATLKVPATANPGLSMNNGFDQVQLKVEGTPPLSVHYDELRIGRSFRSIHPEGAVSARFPERNHADEYRHFPNPTGDRLFIERKDGRAVHHVAIYDLSGRQVFAELYRGALQTKALPPGTYLVRVSDQQGKGAAFRMVKQ